VTLLSAPVRLALGQGSDHDHGDHSHDERFTSIGEGWPPQPKNMDNVVWLPTGSGTARALSRLEGAETLAVRAPQVRAALGDRYVHSGTTAESKKGAPSSKLRVTYFSYTQNATVEVLIDNGRIERLQRIAPGTYQPPLTAEEVDEAVALARAALLAEGYTDATALVGYGILAFRPEPAGRFYDHRVAYVSFHADEDSRPQYVALVDLSDRTVLDLREE
jgi:hypothetical protein